LDLANVGLNQTKLYAGTLDLVNRMEIVKLLENAPAIAG
tara:strand:+ start:145 stop:261 length:117 start_codon:yes stop_codon:yes gene_type:complete